MSGSAAAPARDRALRATVRPPRRDRTKLSTAHALADIPLHQSNWIPALNALLRAHNHHHSVKSKGVSFKTMHDRREFLFRFFRELREVGINLDPRSLGNRHIRVAVALWLERGLGAATIHNYLSFLRGLADWIGKHGMVQPAAYYAPERSRVRRRHVATRDKSWRTSGVDAERKIAEIAAHSEHAAVHLDLQSAFGLRMREAIMLQPHRAVVAAAATAIADPKCAWYLWIGGKRGSKGGRERYVPIDSDAKRGAIERAQRLATCADAHLGYPGCSLKQSMTKLCTILRRFGITRRALGVTAHGLRHQYANDRYAMLTGAPAPVRGGPAIDAATDDAARLAVAQELGHARKQIASAYLGPIPRKKRAPKADRAALKPSRGAPP